MSGPSRAKGPAARVDRARRADHHAARQRLLIVVGAAVVLGALLVAVIVSNRSQASAGLVFGTVTVTGADLPAPPDPTTQPGATDTAVGMAVPQVTGQRFDGTSLTIPASGRPKVVLFIAHWCPHCQKEVPLLTDHLEGGLPADVDLYAVSTDAVEAKGNWPPARWLADAGWPVPTIADSEAGRAAQAYGIGGFPFFVAVDASGKVVARTSGEITLDQFDALVAQARTGST
jgi:cytochrome c biogenesis protein CcmG, thiol:disulfide interchange protein DsbE